MNATTMQNTKSVNIDTSTNLGLLVSLSNSHTSFPSNYVSLQETIEVQHS